MGFYVKAAAIFGKCRQTDEVRKNVGTRTGKIIGVSRMTEENWSSNFWKFKTEVGTSIVVWRLLGYRSQRAIGPNSGFPLQGG